MIKKNEEKEKQLIEKNKEKEKRLIEKNKEKEKRLVEKNEEKERRYQDENKLKPTPNHAHKPHSHVELGTKKNTQHERKTAHHTVGKTKSPQ